MARFGSIFRHQEREDLLLEQMNLWALSGRLWWIQELRGRVSDPVQPLRAAHESKTSGSAGVLLQNEGCMNEKGLLKVDFIGIGAGKCGSTWLFANVVKHPEICDKNLKELNYFSDLYTEHPFEWYEGQFRKCGGNRLKGEFSVTYLGHPEAAGRIYKHYPEVKLLAIIRNPVKRTFSNYLHSLRKGDLPAGYPFSEYIADEKNLLTSRYVDFFSEYLRVFPRDQLLVIVLENFLKDIKAGYREIFDYLGVADVSFFDDSFYEQRNEARSYRLIWLENLLVRSYRWLSRKGHTGLVKRIVDSGVGEVIRKMNRSNKPVPTIDDESKLRLAAYFQPYNDALAQVLSIDLSEWASSK